MQGKHHEADAQTYFAQDNLEMKCLPVIESTIPDMYNLALRKLEDLGNVLGDIKHCALFLSTNVVNFSNNSLMQYASKCFCYVFDIQVAPSCNTYSIASPPSAEAHTTTVRSLAVFSA